MWANLDHSTKKTTAGNAENSRAEGRAPAQQPEKRRYTRRNTKPGQNTAAAGSRPAESQPQAGQEQKRRRGRPPKNPAAAAQPQERKPAEKAAPAGRRPSAKAASYAEPAAVPARRGRRPRQETKPLLITPLGGLNEIGKNITLLEYGDDAFLIDCGMTFPDEDMLGVDIVLPDFTHVLEVKDKIRGIVLTHGHEDHIGGLPYLLKQCNFPIYGARLTLALVESKLREHGLLNRAQLNVVKAGDVVKLGCMSVEFINVNHSIPDAMGLAIKTPVGYVVHTGDFKIDCTPIHGEMINLARFGEIGNEGVRLLMAESTNVERPGYTPSERVVGESFLNLFRKAENKRIIVATFSSNLHRIQQIMDVSAQDGRKVAVSGRSMLNVVTIATELGYLTVPDGLIVDIDTINRYPKDKMTIITTGSQGEPMSALTRMAFSDHRKVEVGPEDYIIISATPIPGNEKAVGRVVNELMKRGCDVVYEKMYDVHTSGHACQEELKIMHGLTRPQFFIPVHGEQKHMQKHAALARSMGMEPSHILIADIGKVIALTEDKLEVVGSVTAGRTLVDGLGVGDVGSIVLRDRKHLAEDGLIVVVATIDPREGIILSGPDIVSRGFVYVREAEPLIEEARKVAREAIEQCCHAGSGEWAAMKTHVRDDLSRMLFQKTKRSPMILPVIMDV